MGEVHHRKCSLCLFFHFFCKSLRDDYQVMDFSVEGRHKKQSSGDFINEKLANGYEKNLTCASFLKTKGNIVAQPISRSRELGCTRTSSRSLHEVYVHQRLGLT